MVFNPPLTRAMRDSSMAPLSMDRLHGLSKFLRWRGSAILSRGLTPSLLGRPICSLAPHISLVKTVYRAPSNQVSTVYLSEPMDVTSYTAGEGSVSMVLSVIRFGMSFASFSSVAAFA